MRVGLVTPYSWTVPGGVNHHIEHLAAELEERGHEPWIIAPMGVLSPTRRAMDSRRQLAAERFIPMGTAVPLPSNGSRAYISINPRVVLRMDRALRYGRFDVLHIHEPGVPSVSLAAVFLAASPVVATFHAALSSSFGYEYFEWLGHMGMKRIDVCIAVSEAAREFPASLFPCDFRIIPNGVAVEKYAPALGAAKVEGRILFIGRAEKRKGLGVLLHAFKELRQRLPHATLVIAGATRGQALEESRVGLGPPLDLEGVEALGWVADDEKVALLAEAEVVCAPSLAAESFGIVLAEAMASGRAVVASDIPGYRSVVQPGVNGVVSPPGNVPALAEAIVALVEDPERRAALAQRGRVRALEFAWPHITDRIEAVYRDVLTKVLVELPAVRETHTFAVIEEVKNDPTIHLPVTRAGKRR
ncbi:MAG: glycosyltransferase [Thermoleophilia bacterium]|nr:glycosyltransferase [Thermoleophilia bacterium]